MVESDHDRPNVRPQATSTDVPLVDEHFVATGAISYVLDHPDKAILIESKPEPMYVTVDDDELTFWCFDYSKKCQVRENVEDLHGPIGTITSYVHAHAQDGYPIDVVDRDVIDDEPKPVATSLGEFE